MRCPNRNNSSATDQGRDGRPTRLIVFSGLPGVGKSSIARELAYKINATYLRIDSIEQALRDSGALVQPMNEAGYGVAYALAEENLRLGRTVVADCVNPISITRNAWREVAARTEARILEIEVRCSDGAEHRRRVESRTVDVPGLVVPTWEEVLAREYHPWDRERLQVDSAVETPEQIVRMIRQMLNL
ncbi:MAG TPA: AAA family ATPase [Candidatus Sulfotelmatobacter sp.]|nr:AAA family ATPase [Candidatus Sulfotelmatobacter sp.]